MHLFPLEHDSFVRYLQVKTSSAGGVQSNEHLQPGRTETKNEGVPPQRDWLAVEFAPFSLSGQLFALDVREISTRKVPII